MVEVLTASLAEVELLKAVKMWARQVRGEGANPLGGGGATVIYYAAIAAARVGGKESMTGLSEGAARTTGFEVDTAYITANHHAGYYPGSAPMHLKLLFAPETGRILGAQVVGFDGVDKRLDVLATALRASKPMTAMNSCVLPDPDSPITPIVSPTRRSKPTFSTAGRGEAPRSRRRATTPGRR